MFVFSLLIFQIFLISTHWNKINIFHDLDNLRASNSNNMRQKTCLDSFQNRLFFLFQDVMPSICEYYSNRKAVFCIDLIIRKFKPWDNIHAG